MSCLRRIVKKALSPILYLFEDDHAPTHKAFKDSLIPYDG